MKTREELRVLWLAALRSGEYEQATGTLRQYMGGFCCLGLLAKIAGILDGGIATFPSEHGLLTDDRGCASLPGGFLKYMGISHFAQARLMTLNDFKHISFPGIADELETGDYWE